MDNQDTDDQERLRNFGVLPSDQSTLYEHDNPMRTTTDDTTDEELDDELTIDCDDFWTFDQFESQDDALDAAADHNDELDGGDE